MHQIKSCVCVLSLVIGILIPGSAHSEGIPNLINYQGRLTTIQGVAVVDGPYLIKFAVYDVAVGGDPLWSCDYQTVQLRNGLFDVRLGESPMPPLPLDLFSTGKVRYLGVKVGTDAEVAPRTPFTSVAYAYQALRADSSLAAIYADTAASASSALYADSAGIAVNATEADSAFHSIYADTALVSVQSDSYERLAYDNAKDSLDSGGFVQLGGSLAIPPNRVNSFVDVRFDCEYTLVVNVSPAYNTQIRYQILIGEAGSESIKDERLIGAIATSGNSSFYGSATYSFCYEPTAAERLNGFNVKFYFQVVDGSGSPGRVKYLGSNVFGK